MPTESKPIELGISCPDFSLLGTDDQHHSLDSYRASPVLVIAFTCNHCPYVQAYEKRLNQWAVHFRSKRVSFVSINSNDDSAYPEDSFAQMKTRAKNLSFQFDYLRDDTQEVAKKFNAACTPEFYVFDQERKLRYHGRLDDNMKDELAVQKFYLRDAIEDLLTGRSVREPQTSAIGCGIKWRKV